VDIIRDRATLAREVEDGKIENVYRLQLMNTREMPQRVVISAQGVEGLAVHGLAQPVEIAPASSRMIAVALRVQAAALKPGANHIEFNITAVGHDGRLAPAEFSIHEKSAFFKPSLR
jgi:polyferredoxin